MEIKQQNLPAHTLMLMLSILIVKRQFVARLHELLMMIFVIKHYTLES